MRSGKLAEDCVDTLMRASQGCRDFCDAFALYTRRRSPRAEGVAKRLQCVIRPQMNDASRPIACTGIKTLSQRLVRSLHFVLILIRLAPF